MEPKVRFPEFNSDWKKMKLCDVIDSKPKNGFSPTPVDYVTDTKVLSISAVTTGVFREECFKYTDYECEKDAECWVKKGDILIQRSNTLELVGSSAMYEGEDNKYIYPDLLMRVHAKQGVDSVFLSNCISSYQTKKYYQKHACGTSGNMPKINQTVVSNTPICMPTLEEQEKIACVLSAIDRRILVQEKIIDDYIEKRKLIVKKIMSREISLGNKGDDWEEISLCELLLERKEKAKKDGKYEHVSLTKEGVVAKSERYERDFLVSSDDKEYKITKLNDICYNPANLKFGVICRNKYGIGIFSPIYVTFETTEKVIPEFMEMVLTRADFINRALKFQQGTVYERMAVSPNDLLSLRIKVPNIDEQLRIAALISLLDKKIEIEKLLLEDWKQMKQACVQQMLV